VHDHDALDLLVKKIGIDRIMLGSDYPFPLGEQAPGELITTSTTLSETDKAKLLGLNALEFFGSRINKERWISETKRE
jgi:aminocarboxymuconate-semialdehyde decarboxylase